MSTYRKIPDEFIQELLIRVDLVDLIDSYVPLRKTGAHFMARCPFHTEKTPSFSVSRDKQLYHCFGCGVGGNAISFLMAFSHLSFVEAIEDLATFVGLPIPQLSVGPKAPNQPDLAIYYALMSQVADFFANQLRTADAGRKAVAYLKKRGLSGEIAKEFMLGYAPEGWQALSGWFDKEALLAVGMVIKKEDGEVYDRFRGRLMFPIRDKRGRVIGFGGRVLDDSVPKYLNSPETALFHKAQEVYGLFELLQKNPKPKRILLVEGYLDVISLAEAGLDIAVAVLGTAVSQAHIHLLFRFSSELVLGFDGDRAGQEAAWRAVDAVFPNLKEGRRVRIMILPLGDDPDSLVRAEGVDSFISRMDASQALSDYFFERLKAGCASLTEVEGRAGLVSQAKPYLEKIPNGIYKDMMYDRLSKLAQFAESTNPGDKAALAPKFSSGNKMSSRTHYADPPQPIQRKVLALLVQNPTLAKLIEEKDIDWDDLVFAGADKFKAILQAVLDKKPVTTALLLEHFRDKPDEKIVRKLAEMDFQLGDGIDAEFNDALDNLVSVNNQLKLDRLWAKQKTEGGLGPDDLKSFQRLLKLKRGKFF